MRNLWLGSGWKMHKTRSEAAEYAHTLKSYLEQNPPRCGLFVVPPYTALATVSEILAGAPVLVGAQNMHWQARGAFTGEISPTMLKDCGAQMVELGHSERRTACGETDETVNLKTLAALEHGLRPLICVGETLAEKTAGQAEVVIARQVTVALQAIPPAGFSRVMIAYEPVWAIGDKGSPASPEYAGRMHAFIRSTLQELTLSRATEPPPAAEIPILYGGSVVLNNAAAYVEQPGIDGLFVGRAALQVDAFIALMKIVAARVV